MRERLRNARAAAESQEMKRKHMQVCVCCSWVCVVGVWWGGCWGGGGGACNASESVHACECVCQNWRGGRGKVARLVDKVC